MGDPFGTDALRAAVLSSWASSPTRFREDANAEEDLRLGGYADAWFVELAQNAADAARAAGVPGRIVVRLVGRELRVANTGAPLTADGVAALASLRASAKRDTDAVGRFGVGFAAVLAVSDAPRVIGRDGGVAFSASRTAAAVAGLPGPAAELARRDEPPVLRLVWAADEAHDGDAAGWDTEVRMPLRPGVDAAALLARARLDAPDLLLALPDLHEITVDGESVRRDGPDGIATVDGRRWRLVRRTGRLDVGDRAVEQRDRRDWTVCWALPLDGALPAGEVLHAPTSTGERLALPARLIASVPLEPDRRRARPGPVTDRVLAAAAEAYVDLVRALDPGMRVALVPEPGFPRSALDGRLRELVVDALRAAPWLGAAELVPADAQWLDLPGADDGELPALLAVTGVFDSLVTAPVPAALGVERLGPAGLVERLHDVDEPPPWWRALYAALAPLADTVPHLLDDLRALPVPLADGRRAAGPPTVLLPAAGVTWPLPLPGLHLAHPDAVHPLLERLGASVAGPRALLEHPALRVAVDDSVDDADPRPLAEAVLALVGELGAAPDGYGALALPDVHGVPTRADELMLPDAALRPLLAPDAPLGVVDAPWADRAALVAVGVTDGFALVLDEQPAAPEHDLDDEDRWWDSLAGAPRRMAAVRDLDLIADDAWPAALDLLAAGRETHAALTEPGSYTAWWLARHARLAGRRPDHWRLPSATALAALVDPVPEPATRGRESSDSREVPRVAGFPPPSRTAVPDPREGVWAAIGVRADLAVDDADAAADLLERLADPGRRPSAGLVAEAHAALTAAVADGRVHPDDVDAPERVRALDGSVVSVDVAVVLDAPWPAAVLPAGELVAGGDPAVLADLLDLPLATEVLAGDVEGAGRAVAWADLVEAVVACHTLGIAVPPGAVTVHDELWVAVTRPVTGRFRVPAWPDGVGGWHAEDPLRGLLALVAP